MLSRVLYSRAAVHRQAQLLAAYAFTVEAANKHITLEILDLEYE
jgi:hypothetical protein